MRAPATRTRPRLGRFALQASNSETRLFGYLMAASFLLGFFQLALGASPLVVFLTLITGMVAILPCVFYGLGRTVGILFLMIWYQFSFGELITKTALFQPIDSNLYNPVLSHLIVLTGAVSFTIGALAARWATPWRGNLVRPELDPVKLRALAIAFLVLWAASFPVGAMGQTGKAISVFMRNYLFAAMACELAATIIATRGQRTFSIFGATITVFAMMLSLAFNSKTGILAAAICYLFTTFCLGRRPSWKIIAAVLPAIVIMTVSIAPAIHLARNYRERINPIAMLGVTSVKAVGLIIRDPEVVREAADAKRLDLRSDNGLYRQHYLGASSVWLDRFIVVGFVDAFARRLTYDGPFFGLPFVLNQTKEALPQQLTGPKSDYTSGTMIMQTLGLVERDQKLFNTLPSPVELFFANGFWGIILVGSAMMYLSLAALNVVAFDFKFNIWSVYLLTSYGYFFGMQSYLGFVFFTLRQLPSDAIIIVGCGWAAQIIAQQFTRSGRGALTAGQSVRPRRAVPQLAVSPAGTLSPTSMAPDEKD